MVIETIDRFKPIFSDREVKVGWDIQDELYGYFDRKRINRVLDNIISNAIKYVRGDGEISISLRNTEDGILLKVINDIEEGERIDIDKIWDRFYKADDSRSRIKGGTGLGLAITRGILEAHNFRFGGIKKDNNIEIYIVFND